MKLKLRKREDCPDTSIQFKLFKLSPLKNNGAILRSQLPKPVPTYAGISDTVLAVQRYPRVITMPFWFTFSSDSCYNFRGITSLTLSLLSLHLQSSVVQSAQPQNLSILLSIQVYDCEFKSNLTRCLRNHAVGRHGFDEGEVTKLFKCSGCEFETKPLQYLNLHRESNHNQKTRYECNLCAYKYARQQTVGYHQRKKHGNDS